MTILEVIHLRMAGVGAQTLVDVIRESVRSDPELSDISIYRHATLETDLVVHLHRSTPDKGDRACACGERLASLLRGYGMVEHSVWLETAGE
jgi:hypothetical protein